MLLDTRDELGSVSGISLVASASGAGVVSGVEIVVSCAGGIVEEAWTSGLEVVPAAGPETGVVERPQEAPATLRVVP